MKITALIIAILAASIAAKPKTILDSCLYNAIAKTYDAWSLSDSEHILIDDPEDRDAETYSVVTLNNGTMWAMNTDDLWHAQHIDTLMIVHDDPDDNTKWTMWNVDQEDVHGIDVSPVILKKGERE
jgi:hypothetical protein